MMIDRPERPRRSLAVFAALAYVAGYSATASATHVVDLAHIYGAPDKTEAATAAQHVQESLESAPSRQIVRWKSADRRVSGTITPLRTFKIRSGHFCRELIEAVAVGPDLRSEVQVACRDRQGHWQRVKS